MNDHDEALTSAVRESLDASTESLPPGVASRLAAARADALEAGTRSGWLERWFAPRVGWAGAALGSVAVLVLALALLPDNGAERAPTIADGAAPIPAGAPGEGPALDLEDLEVAANLELMEDLEFVAWLALEDGVLEPVDAG
jgi:hypothetical protein